MVCLRTASEGSIPSVGVTLDLIGRHGCEADHSCAVFFVNFLGIFGKRSSSDRFYEMGPDLCFTYLSERFEEVTDIPPSRVISKTREEIGCGSIDEESWDRRLADLRGHRPLKDFRFQVVGGQERTL